MVLLHDINLDYNNVTLISRQISSIYSRDNIDISSELFPGLRLEIPIIASPMTDVVNVEVASELRRLGGFAFLHRFCSIEDQILSYKEVTKRWDCGCAIGLDDLPRLKKLIDCGCKYFILDIANGANLRVKKYLIQIDELNKGINEIYFIVGNIVSGEQYKWCSLLPNVYGVRVGVAGGKACTTKNATGIFHGAVSLLQECSNVITNCRIIADGGIKGPDEFSKSLAFGGNFAMLGSLIANCRNSPAELIYKDGSAYKVYHGSSSYDNQLLYKDKPRYIEGKTVLLEYHNESLEDLIIRLKEGLKSSMSYFNANSLEEYRKNIDWLVCL